MLSSRGELSIGAVGTLWKGLIIDTDRAFFDASHLPQNEPDA